MEKIREGKYTKTYASDERTHCNAHNKYEIFGHLESSDISYNKSLLEINFQNGPIKEAGVNGVMNEDLISIVIDRMRSFQSSEYACRENALALTKLEEALMWLEKRTADRELRGVEGTHIV